MIGSKKPKKWMQHLKLHRGAFTAKADAAGMTVPEYADKVLSPESHASGRTKKQANLAQVFARAKH